MTRKKWGWCRWMVAEETEFSTAGRVTLSPSKGVLAISPDILLEATPVPLNKVEFTVGLGVKDNQLPTAL